jgi:hypothetical protein
MAKDRSFSAKVAKSQATPSRVCPVCKEAQNTLLLIQSAQNGDKASYRFKEKFVAVCKCNEKEILG